ncbi:hypothetical protein [Paraburkholderia sp. SIMBA_054]|uniref:hypothetical protein n=1 Tax=Paraburkholderia sp. SIMBA_054 TaxID=3085795 RepID=UPI00397CD196
MTSSLFSPLASPALVLRGGSYPYGERVPSRVRMRRTCWPDHADAMNVPLLPIAFVGQEYGCYVSSQGDIATFLPFDQLLMVDRDSFDVVSWHPRRDALP